MRDLEKKITITTTKQSNNRASNITTMFQFNSKNAIHTIEYSNRFSLELSVFSFCLFFLIVFIVLAYDAVSPNEQVWFLIKIISLSMWINFFFLFI